MSDITDRLQECADHFPVIEDNPYSVFVDAKNEITSLRKQLEQAQGGQGAEPVAWLIYDENGNPLQPTTSEEIAELSEARSGRDSVPLYTQPQPAQLGSVPGDKWRITGETLYVRLAKDLSGGPDETFVEIEDGNGNSVRIERSEDGNDWLIGPLYKAPKVLSIPTTPQGDGCTCQKCHAVYDGDLMVPNDIWEKIKPDGKPAGSGLLCPNCMVSIIVNRGIWTALVGQDIDLTNAKNTGWISCVKRLPAEKDADCEGCVWHSDGHLVHTAYFGHVKADPDHYWMPTGLKRPQPPKEDE